MKLIRYCLDVEECGFSEAVEDYEPSICSACYAPAFTYREEHIPYIHSNDPAVEALLMEILRETLGKQNDS